MTLEARLQQLQIDLQVNPAGVPAARIQDLLAEAIIVLKIRRRRRR